MNRLGPYEVGEELARGSMGVVYRARDPFLERDLALKVVNADKLSSPRAQERFRREVLALARLRHSRIVAVHGAGVTSQGLPFLVMDLVKGGDLGERLEAGPLAPPEAVRLAIQVAEAAGYAHSRGLLHRDIKPENVLVDDAGEVCLSDFGLAKLVGEERLTRTGEIVGTPSYMAPEQLRGKKTDYTAAVDIYALGATLYHMLTGRPPFEGTSMQELLIKVVAEPHVPVGDVVALEDELLEAIVARSLAKEPEARFSSMEEFSRALTDWLARRCPPLGGEAELDKPLLQAPRASRATALGALLLGIVAGIAVGVAVAGPLERSQRSWLSFVELPAESRALYRRGEQRMERDDFLGAKEDFERVTQAEPACSDAWLSLGLALAALEEPEAALQCQLRAIRLEPEFSSAWHEQGKLLLEAKRPLEAVKAFEAAVAADPKSAPVRLSLAVALRATGEHASAQLAWEESCRLDPRLGQNAVYEAIYMGLEPLARLKVLERARKLDPKNRELLLVRAALYEELGRLDESLEAYNDALRLGIEDTLVLRRRAKVFMLQRKFTEAFGDLGVALELYPGDASARVTRGAYLWSSARYQQALPDFEAVAGDPSVDPDVAKSASERAEAIREALAAKRYVLRRKTLLYASLATGEAKGWVTADCRVTVKSSQRVEGKSTVWANVTVETSQGRLTGYLDTAALLLDVKDPGSGD